MADRDMLLAQFIQITACNPARARTALSARFVHAHSIISFMYVRYAQSLETDAET